MFPKIDVVSQIRNSLLGELVNQGVSFGFRTLFFLAFNFLEMFEG